VPSRLAIYGRLGSAGMSVIRVAEELGLAPSTVSFHLGVLRHAGLVTVVTRGREHVYTQTARRWFLVSGDADGPGEHGAASRSHP
jgi:DNA-binding transcriptional ArsR family regulator